MMIGTLSSAQKLMLSLLPKCSYKHHIGNMCKSWKLQSVNIKIRMVKGGIYLWKTSISATYWPLHDDATTSYYETLHDLFHNTGSLQRLSSQVISFLPSLLSLKSYPIFQKSYTQATLFVCMYVDSHTILKTPMISSISSAISILLILWTP